MRRSSAGPKIWVALSSQVVVPYKAGQKVLIKCSPNSLKIGLLRAEYAYFLLTVECISVLRNKRSVTIRRVRNVGRR
jgi:hypothetical protein